MIGLVTILIPLVILIIFLVNIRMTQNARDESRESFETISKAVSKQTEFINEWVKEIDPEAHLDITVLPKKDLKHYSPKQDPDNVMSGKVIDIFD